MLSAVGTDNLLRENNIKIINETAASTLIFAHGFGTDQTSWDETVAAFQDEYRIILFDNVGVGKADPEAFSPNKYDNLNA